VNTWAGNTGKSIANDEIFIFLCVAAESRRPGIADIFSQMKQREWCPALAHAGCKLTGTRCLATVCRISRLSEITNCGA